jgi:hypothetical protein
VIAGMCVIQKTHQPNASHRQTSHELHEIDLTFHQRLKVYVVEIHSRPDLGESDSDLGRKVKYPLNLDVRRMDRMIEYHALDDEPCLCLVEIVNRVRESLERQKVKTVEETNVIP